MENIGVDGFHSFPLMRPGYFEPPESLSLKDCTWFFLKWKQGSFKDSFCNHVKHGFFNTEPKGKPPFTSCNVQVDLLHPDPCGKSPGSSLGGWA